MKVTELSYSRAMHNQNYPQHMYVLHWQYCGNYILLPFYVLPQHIVYSIVLVTTIRANGCKGAHGSQAQS